MTYGGPGSAGHVGQHIKDHHQAEIEQEQHRWTDNIHGSGKNAIYQVYAEKVGWDDIEFVQRKRGPVPVEEVRPS